MPLSAAHLDGPAPRDTTTDEHGFVTFWGLATGQDEVTGVSRTGIAIAKTKITYATARTVLGSRGAGARVRRTSGGTDSCGAPSR